MSFLERWSSKYTLRIMSSSHKQIYMLSLNKIKHEIRQRTSIKNNYVVVFSFHCFYQFPSLDLLFCFYLFIVHCLHIIDRNRLRNFKIQLQLHPLSPSPLMARFVTAFEDNLSIFLTSTTLLPAILIQNYGIRESKVEANSIDVEHQG